MTLTRTAQRTLTAVFAAVLLILYALAWAKPGVGLWREDAINLLRARTLGQSPEVSLFPLILAPFAHLANPILKLIPLLCTAAWLCLTWRLLERMGASRSAALLLTGLTAAAPAAIHISSTLLAQSLFGVLIAATLLALLSDRSITAGCFAAFATITEPAGAALIVACIFTFLARRRFRSAVQFSLAAMLIAAPWCGWTLAHLPADSPLHRLILLPANEKLSLIGRNFLSLFAAPFEVLTGIHSLYAASTTGFLLIWALIRRRQFVPDLFLLLYSIALVCWPSPPQAAIAPVLPLILWLLWRAFHPTLIREALAAMILILVSLSLWADVAQIRRAPENDWNQMQLIFTWLRGHTAPGDVIMANLNPLIELNTGRTSVRGFVNAATPDELSATIQREGVAYVVVTPDHNLPENGVYHHAVEALERGGMIEPASIPELSRGYRILRTHRGY